MISMSLVKGAVRRYLETIDELAAKGAKVHVAARLAGCAILIIAATLAFPPLCAQAQFIGQDFATGTADGASALGLFSTAVGQGANASGTLSTAVGQSSTASGNGSTAVGQGATAAFSNSAAFGNGAAATAANQQMFGTSANTYTTPGITSAASKAAQTGPVQLVTSDAGGDLATSSLSSLGLASSADISALNSSINNVANRAYSGVAMAFAMAGVPTVLPGETFVTTMNYGTFEGANAMSFNGAMRVSDHVQFDAGIGYAPDQGIVGGRAGVRMGW